jgi:Vitamin B6 photo-protection and homoeostasis
MVIAHARRAARASARPRSPCARAVQEHESGGLAFRRLWASFLVPQGYPDSVSPHYTEYMFWRGVQYFFGGALSLFTTRALLASVGVRRGASTSAAAINWVLKDGAGRVGRFLFARWGHQLDCELKQFRLLGDGLMEAGALLELSTIALPRQFLLLACTANMTKNLAAVAASSTRAPIYRSFALQNNMADVTAKGESVANLSDVLGVAAGIALSKLRWPMAATFGLLSCGYLLASRKEVDSVVLPYLNQARDFFVFWQVRAMVRKGILTVVGR